MRDQGLKKLMMMMEMEQRGGGYKYGKTIGRMSTLRESVTPRWRGRGVFRQVVVPRRTTRKVMNSTIQSFLARNQADRLLCKGLIVSYLDEDV